MIEELRKELKKRSEDEDFVTGVCAFIQKHNKIKEMLDYLDSNPNADQIDICLYEHELLKPIISTKEYQLQVNNKLREMELI